MNFISYPHLILLISGQTFEITVALKRFQLSKHSLFRFKAATTKLLPATAGFQAFFSKIIFFNYFSQNNKKIYRNSPLAPNQRSPGGLAPTQRTPGSPRTPIRRKIIKNIANRSLGILAPRSQRAPGPHMHFFHFLFFMIFCGIFCRIIQ